MVMKYLKSYNLFESKTDVMYEIYDADELDRIDLIIDDIKDMVLELGDIGLYTTVGYTPMTLVGREKTPKIMVEIQGDSLLCSYNEDDIYSAFERIKEYTSSKGYVTGFGNWERETIDSNGRKNISVYQMLIQK
jgi:hypothetical protein